MNTLRDTPPQHHFDVEHLGSGLGLFGVAPLHGPQWPEHPGIDTSMLDLKATLVHPLGHLGVNSSPRTAPKSSRQIEPKIEPTTARHVVSSYPSKHHQKPAISGELNWVGSVAVAGLIEPLLDHDLST